MKYRMSPTLAGTYQPTYAKTTTLVSNLAQLVSHLSKFIPVLGTYSICQASNASWSIAFHVEIPWMAIDWDDIIVMMRMITHIQNKNTGRVSSIPEYDSASIIHISAFSNLHSCRPPISTYNMEHTNQTYA